MPSDIAAEIEALHQMTTGGLAERYETLHGQPSRTRHRAHLVRRIAGRIQDKLTRDLTEGTWTRTAEHGGTPVVRAMAPNDAFGFDLAHLRLRVESRASWGWRGLDGIAARR